MDQDASDEKKQGPVSQSINALNNLGGAFRTARDAQSLIKGTQAATAGARLVAAAASSPVGWIIAGVIAVVVILVFVIVFFQGTDNKDFAFAPPPSISPSLAPSSLLSLPPDTIQRNTCTAPYEGRRYCSIENLMSYFGGDEKKALIASMICKKESSSDPFAINKKCPPDYSVGLFQINLLYNCAGAYTDTNACILKNENVRNQCEQIYMNPEENIRKMLGLSNNGTVWTPWSVWEKAPGIKTVKQILAECGIVQ